MEEIGPVDYAIVAFPGNKFRGEIGPAIAELVENGTIRVIDIAFVGKDEDGNAVAMELLELDPDVQKALNSIGIEVGGLLNDDDLIDAAEGLEPNSSAAMIVWENVWARKVAQAIRDAGGQPWRSSGYRTKLSSLPANGRSSRRKPRRRRRMFGRQRTRARAGGRDDGCRRRDRRRSPTPPGPEVRRAGSGGVRAADGRAAGGRAAATPTRRSGRARLHGRARSSWRS